MARPLQGTAKFVEAHSLEVDDLVDTSNATHINFDLTAQNASLDAINFTPTKGAKTCFNVVLPLGTKLLFGLKRVELTPTFDLETLKSCTP